jgi:hypothetical protein
VLKKYYPVFSHQNINSEYLFSTIYHDRSFEDKTMRYLLSELLELAEKFIALDLFEKDSTELNKQIINAMMSRKLYSQAYRMLKTSEDKLEKDFSISYTYIINKLEYSEMWKQLTFLTNRQDPQLDKRITQAEYLTFRNFIELVNLTQTLNVLRLNYNAQPDDNAMYALVENIDYRSVHSYLCKMEDKIKDDKNRYNFINSLKIYICYMITFLDTKDEEYFYKMKKLVDEFGKYFEKEELQNLYVMLLSSCNLKRKTIDSEKYIRNYFEVMKSGLSMGLFAAYEGQYMDVAGFYRMFQTALHLKELNWAREFKDKYIPLLSPEFTEDITNYTNAEIYFYRKQYDESLTHISRVRFSYKRLKLNVRTVTLMNYYEKEFIEEAFSLLDSFSHLLSGNEKFNAEVRELNTNFISFFRDILKYKANGSSRKKIEDLRAALKNCHKIENKNWLMDKIEELYRS